VKGPPVPIVQEAGWSSEVVWTHRLQKKVFASAGDRTPVVQSVVRNYTDSAHNLHISITSYASRGSYLQEGLWVQCQHETFKITLTKNLYFQGKNDLYNEILLLMELRLQESMLQSVGFLNEVV
jgi:hypothetical protein